MLAHAALGVSVIKLVLFQAPWRTNKKSKHYSIGNSDSTLLPHLPSPSLRSFSPTPSTIPNTTKPTKSPEGEISNYYHQSDIDRIYEVLEEMGEFKGEHDSQLSRSGLLSCGYFHINPGELEVLRCDELCFKLGYLCVG
jgi:hypothetical protein